MSNLEVAASTMEKYLAAPDIVVSRQFAAAENYFANAGASSFRSRSEAPVTA